MVLNPRAVPPRSSFSARGSPGELTHAFSSAEAEREGGLNCVEIER